MQTSKKKNKKERKKFLRKLYIFILFYFFAEMKGSSLLWGLTFFNVLRPNVANTKLKEKFAWKEVDFAFPTPEDREKAINSKKFIPSNTLPLGVDVSVQ